LHGQLHFSPRTGSRRNPRSLLFDRRGLDPEDNFNLFCRGIAEDEPHDLSLPWR
jgi:hypothetical protein